jgi:fatty-acyl-CoA synthase
MIISGGENVYSAEVENILIECPDIVEAAVVGAPHEVWGEVVVALVVLRQNMSEANVTELFEGRLARYKHPRRVVFLDILPRNAMGKVKKDQLRQQIAEKPMKRQAG